MRTRTEESLSAQRWSATRAAALSLLAVALALAPGGQASAAPDNAIAQAGGATGPFKVKAELWYQPIGFRWAHNLAPYQASEPQRMVRYYEAAAGNSATVLARAEATR